MKKLIALILLSFYLQTSFATNYYISTSGSDSNNGTDPTTPWLTLGKANAGTYNPGDAILLLRGDIFYGVLNITSSGNSTNHITIGSYGTSTLPNPIITGFETLSSWTSYGSGIYYSAFTKATTSIALLGGQIEVRGRYPNSHMLNYQSFSGLTSVTSDSLTGTPNWTGAEIVMKNMNWIVDGYTITSQSAGTITYTKTPLVGETDSYSPTAGSWFFIQNDIRTLDTLGEYYSNGTDFYMYFGSVSTAPVQVSSEDYNIEVTGNYIDVNSVDITGSTLSGIYFNGNSNFTYTNGNSTYQGGFAMDGHASNVLITNFNADNSLAGGIRINGTNVKVTQSFINNSGLYPGNLFSGDGAGASGTSLTGLKDTINYCTIKNSGYAGIDVNGTDNLVDRNRIDSFALVKNDIGAIYASNVASNNYRITNNIISNGSIIPYNWTVGTYDGDVNGIYIDNGAYGAYISNNTVFNVPTNGIYLQANSYKDTICYNTVFNCASQLCFYSTPTIDIPKQVYVKNNIFVAKTTGQYSFQFLYSRTGDIDSIGTLDSNYYLRPISPSESIMTWLQVSPYTSNYLDISGWQSFSEEDAHSFSSTKTITSTDSLTFLFNSSSSSSVTSVLPYNYIDAKGVDYNGSITLLPFTSALLIYDGAFIDHLTWPHRFRVKFHNQ